MADQKLTELPYVTALTSSDLVYVVQNGISYKIAASSLATNILNGALQATSATAMVLVNSPLIGNKTIDITADFSNDITGVYLDALGTAQVYSSGNVQIISNTSVYPFTWQFNSNGTTSLPIPGYVPTYSTSTGSIGQVSWTSSYVYVCVATNTWKRTPLNTW